MMIRTPRRLRRGLVCVAAIGVVGCAGAATETSETATEPNAQTSLGSNEVDADGCEHLVPGVHHIALTAGGATHGVRVFVPTKSGDGEPLPGLVHIDAGVRAQ